jgi:hypothetical protein
MKIKVTYEKVFDSADHFDPDFEFTAREFNRIIEEYLEEDFFRRFYQ